MKKAYFITYLGAIITCLSTFLFVNKTAKKYGQAVKPKKEISLNSIFGGAEKLIDLVKSFK